MKGSDIGVSEPLRRRRHEAAWSQTVSRVKREFHKLDVQKDVETPADRAAQITARATKAIAYLTGFLAIIACLQLYEIVIGGADTRAIASAATQQAYAAQRFSKSASDAVDRLSSLVDSSSAATRLSEHNFRVDQRAWIGLTSVDPLPEKGQISGLRAIIRNFGRTPAFSVSPRSTFVIEMNTATPKFPSDMFANQGELEYVPDVSYFLETISAPNSPSLTGEFISTLLQSSRTVYFFGRIDYTDAFSVKHWVKFCEKLLPNRTWASCVSHDFKATDRNDEGPADPKPPRQDPHSKPN